MGIVVKVVGVGMIVSMSVEPLGYSIGILGDGTGVRWVMVSVIEVCGVCSSQHKIKIKLGGICPWWGV